MEKATWVLWKTIRSKKEKSKDMPAPRLSAILPSELNELILGYSKYPSSALCLRDHDDLAYLQRTV